MVIVLFGKQINKENIGKLILLIDRLKGYENVELFFCYSLYKILEEANYKILEDKILCSLDGFSKKIDLFLSLGGDGTYLESLTMVKNKDIPIAGINFGRLGFLTTAKVGDNNQWIDQLINKEYKIEERTLLKLNSQAIPADFYPYALNEITIQRVSPSMLELDIIINGENLPKYWADGILIATATGSTAYSLSIGGPIVAPNSKVLIIAPIAPHNLNIRPLIIPDSSTIEISFNSRNKGALLTMDNRFFNIGNGEKVVITKGEFSISSIALNYNFISALNEKLLWGEDKRNIR
jgi:Predicted sugar kinase